MNNIKLSLVFACYNISQYLKDLYQLLISQPYQNIEIIFVEDCSTDNTKEILRSFTDSRVKLIENPSNQGAAISRNIGISHSTGDYVGFPDPDDLFESDWLSHIASIIESYHPKVVVSGIREDYEKDGKYLYSIDTCPEMNGVISSDNFIKGLIDLEKSMIFGNMANKFYLTLFLKENNLQCKTMALKEDFEFNIQVFNLVDEFYIVNKPHYFYKKRINGNSLTSKFVPEYFEIHLNSVLMFKDLLQRKGILSDSAKSLLVDRFFRYFLSAVERNTNKQANLSFVQQKEWIKNVIESDKRISWFLENKHFMRSKLKFLPILVNLKAYTSIAFLGQVMKYIKQYASNFFTKLK
ncbi:glycosyltransferase family 2 protein [Actinobacillus equuli subsp. haemolyticus]|uniref:glycosyltransferase family 2 protein n=1 Tax=Actinobacillus equuli TaxID=718 RepID=UPI0024418981|nr:glycosyltransferase family 2 protein [Actinobacillus equuli]WGE81277.1 glycosyltransferase family 2 protein [Actinobacillus equuli subsp. haemolyticus]